MLFSVILKDKIVGGEGIKIDQQRKSIGEAGSFIDHDYWGKGIASKAVNLIEKISFNHLQLTRMDIIMLKKNISSQRVVQKCDYRKEGIQRSKFIFDGKYPDA